MSLLSPSFRAESVDDDAIFDFAAAVDQEENEASKEDLLVLEALVGNMDVDETRQQQQFLSPRTLSDGGGGGSSSSSRRSSSCFSRSNSSKIKGKRGSGKRSPRPSQAQIAQEVRKLSKGKKELTHFQVRVCLNSSESMLISFDNYLVPSGSVILC